MSIRVRVLVSAGDAVRHPGPTHAQDLLRHEESATETRGGAPTRDRRHRLGTATEETRGGGHTRDPARRHHREEKTAVGGSEARRRIGRVVERRGGGWMWICNRCCGLSQSQKLTRDRRHTLPSKSVRIRAGMMSISVPTNPQNRSYLQRRSLYISPSKTPSPLQETLHPPNHPPNYYQPNIWHDNRRSSPANTDHAGAYAFRHQELPRARERGFAWGLNSWEGRREGGGVAEGERKKERVGRGRVRLAKRSTWMRKKTFSAMTEYAFR